MGGIARYGNMLWQAVQRCVAEECAKQGSISAEQGCISAKQSGVSVERGGVAEGRIAESYRAEGGVAEGGVAESGRPESYRAEGGAGAPLLRAFGRCETFRFGGMGVAPEGFAAKATRVRYAVTSRLWERGIALDPFGRVRKRCTTTFSPSLFFPPVRGAKLIPTVHDIIPWTHPYAFTKRGVLWHKKMLHQAYNTAAKIAVPSMATANDLRTLYNFGDRVFLLPPGHFVGDVPRQEDINSAKRELKLPQDYIMCIGTLEPRKGIDALIAALAQPNLQDVHLVHAGPAGWGCGY